MSPNLTRSQREGCTIKTRAAPRVVGGDAAFDRMHSTIIDILGRNVITIAVSTDLDLPVVIPWYETSWPYIEKSILYYHKGDLFWR